MKNIAVACFFYLVVILKSVAQGHDVSFASSDTALQTAFYRAKAMALSYEGKPQDPVGAWYESALPPRSAFCMRDVSHQSIAAEILGLDAGNRNMTKLFVQNISKNKDWCSYWEIDKYGKPAKEDYRDDKSFWYNLNANFDILTACWKLYLWTGDKTYLENPDYINFYQRSTGDFIDTWVLQVDSLLSRPSHPHEASGYDRKDSFHEYRGLPSYSEGVPHVKMGVDLIASIYRGLLSYSAILRLSNKIQEAKTYEQKAAAYQRHIETQWWDKNTSRYNTHYTEENTFGMGEGETFLLWFDALKDPERKQKTIAHLLSKTWNIENQSYHPYQFYRYGYSKEAYRSVLHLTNPSTKRRDYPEVSFGVIQAIVQGLMGIEAYAPTRTIRTMFRGHNEVTTELKQLPILGNFVDIRHDGQRISSVKNSGVESINWNAGFAGTHEYLFVGQKRVKARQETGLDGKVFSLIELTVAPGETSSVAVE